jgi:hypothetical protein
MNIYIFISFYNSYNSYITDLSKISLRLLTNYPILIAITPNFTISFLTHLAVYYKSSLFYYLIV